MGGQLPRKGVVNFLANGWSTRSAIEQALTLTPPQAWPETLELSHLLGPERLDRGIHPSRVKDCRTLWALRTKTSGVSAHLGSRFWSIDGGKKVESQWPPVAPIAPALI